MILLLAATPVFDLTPILMPLIGLFVFIFLLKIGPQIYEAWRLAQAGMPEIDRMTGLEFEKYLEILFHRLGYQVERTPYIGDQGADLILTRGGERTLVQAKRYKKPVGNKAVQEAAAARPHYGCHRAMIVTNSHLTKAALELARSNQIEVWDRSTLAKKVLEIQATPAQVAATQAAASAQPAIKPTPIASSRPKPDLKTNEHPVCTKCGRQMVLREGPRGKFWGCSGFPRCRNTMPIG